jgi:hypothetical protein
MDLEENNRKAFENTKRVQIFATEMSSPPPYIEMPHEMLAETATLMWYELEKYKSLFGDSKSEKLKTKIEEGKETEQERTEAQERNKQKKKSNSTRTKSNKR